MFIIATENCARHRHNVANNSIVCSEPDDENLQVVSSPITTMVVNASNDLEEEQQLRQDVGIETSTRKTADEEVANDLNGPSDIDLSNTMKSASNNANHGANRRIQPMDMNMYATRKTIAQGIMDLGLMCANASQLKYVLLNSAQHRYFQVTISLIVISIIFQVIVGIFFIALGRLNINYSQDRRKADMMNNASVILIFLITVVNVLITAFGPSESFSHLYNSAGALTPNKLNSWTNFYPGSRANEPTTD